MPQIPTERQRKDWAFVQIPSAHEAKELGLLAEVLPRDQVLALRLGRCGHRRKKPTLLGRYSRLIEYLKKRTQNPLDYVLAMDRCCQAANVDRLRRRIRPNAARSTAPAEMRDHVRVTDLGRKVVSHDGERALAIGCPERGVVQ